MDSLLPFAGRAFPASMFTTDLKCRHYTVFWALCNSVAHLTDDTRWTFIEVKPFEKALQQESSGCRGNIALVAALKVLEKRGYIELVVLKMTGSVFKEVKVRVKDDAWDHKEHPKRPPQDRSDYMRRRQEIRRLAKANESN